MSCVGWQYGRDSLSRTCCAGRYRSYIKLIAKVFTRTFTKGCTQDRKISAVDAMRVEREGHASATSTSGDDVE